MAVASVLPIPTEDASRAASVERVKVWLRPGSDKSIKRFTKSSLLVILAASCVSVATWDAVNLTKPHAPATGVIAPVEELIVAIFVLLDEYTIGAELLLVGNVIGENAASVFIL